MLALQEAERPCRVILFTNHYYAFGLLRLDLDGLFFTNILWLFSKCSLQESLNVSKLLEHILQSSVC